ncbi:helix-turn-helix transcriptional regulator [Parasphingorhabdus flavimaris]|uniref:helix-turn-helix transcriptional regulator n=1 Tax=Parasphingorhabdus flavimaris TaxID=266812 RepID=UPI003003578F
MKHLQTFDTGKQAQPVEAALSKSQESSRKKDVGPRVVTKLEFWRRRRVLERVGCSSTTLHRWVKDEFFPAPIKIGGITRWRSTDVDGWMQRMSDDAEAA